MATEMFWTGVLFGVCMTLLILGTIVAAYVNARGAFIIGPSQKEEQ